MRFRKNLKLKMQIQGYYIPRLWSWCKSLTKDGPWGGPFGGLLASSAFHFLRFVWCSFFRLPWSSGDSKKCSMCWLLWEHYCLFIFIACRLIDKTNVVFRSTLPWVVIGSIICCSCLHVGTYFQSSMANMLLFANKPLAISSVGKRVFFP